MDYATTTRPDSMQVPTSTVSRSDGRVAPIAPAAVANAFARRLKDREKRILRLVCDGMTNTEIAAAMGVTYESVKCELRRIFRRMEVLNRTQAAVVVIRHRLL